MTLKTLISVIVLMTIGLVVSSYFVGGVLTTQVIKPFGSISSIEVVDGVAEIPISTNVTFVDADLIKGWIPWVIRQVSILIGGLSLVVFLYAGISLILYGDNEEQLGKSMKMIVFGIVGIVLAAFSYSIVANLLSLF